MQPMFVHANTTDQLATSNFPLPTCNLPHG